MMRIHDDCSGVDDYLVMFYSLFHVFICLLVYLFIHSFVLFTYPLIGHSCSLYIYIFIQWSLFDYLC